MPYDARTVANYFLELADHDHIPVGPLKLQKLVYLAHGWHLVFFGRPLIKNDVEAWRYGPVVPALYREFKEFGASPITRRARGFDTDTLDEDAKRLIDAVWNKYKMLSAAQLSAITHERNSAWDMTLRNSSPFDRLTIVDALIADEFQRRRQADGRAAY